MKIDILCSDGSPLGVTSKTIFGDAWRVGVGGAELALLTMCEQWTERGYDVSLYNNPNEQGSKFSQYPISAFDPLQDRDIVIVFRSPNLNVADAKGLKCWWSCDQYSRGNYGKFRQFVDKVVCISPFHVSYFKTTYDIDDAICIDLPVRIHEIEKIDKIPNKFVFTSVPDRGLRPLLDMWGDIKELMPDATLSITSDYRLWGASSPLNDKYRVLALGKKGVKFLGAINRLEMLKEVAEAEWFLYPCEYEELFCISCAEAQVSGAYPITSNIGALPDTNMGTVLNTSGFRKSALDALQVLSANKEELQEQVRSKAINRFHPDRILDEWDKEVFGI